MDFFLDPFLLGFQQRALIGGLIAAVMCAVVGVWLVLRGMSFFGDAFVHGVMPGIAASVVLGFSAYLGAALAALVMLVGVELVHRHTRLKEDTGIGLLFVGMLALGVVIISKSRSYAGSLTGILFGDALGVSADDLRAQALLAVIVVLVAMVLYRPLLALSFDRRKAQSLRIHPARSHALLLVLIAAAVIGSFQAVGTLLVFGLLVGPAASATLVARTVPQMVAVSVVIGVVSVWAGLLVSYHLGTAGSATMALMPVGFFFILLAITRVRGAILSRRAAGAGEPSAAAAHVRTLSHDHVGVPIDREPGGALAVGNDVTLGYGETVAVAASSFTIPRGAVTAIIGPNGSGKSTLLHAIAGLVPVHGGELTVHGVAPDRLRDRLAYVMQSIEVPDGTPITVAEAVGMGRYPALGPVRRFTAADKERVALAMDELEVTHLRRRHLSELSGGQRQRVYVAQAMAQDHDSLLLDEPLTGLDIVSARTIDRIIHTEQAHGHSVVLTTHDLEEARAADHVILMSGRVVASGAPEVALTRRNLEVAYGLGALHGDDASAADVEDAAVLDGHDHC